MTYRVSAPRSNKRLHGALLTSAMLAIATMPAAAHAQAAATDAQASRDIHFNVSPQELDSALTSIADQGGVHIFFTSAELAGRRTNGVSGLMTVEQALSQALTGTGFGWRYREPGTVIIEKLPDTQGAIQLGPVRVEGDSGQSGAALALGGNLRGPSPDPVVQRLNPQTTVGSKDPVSQREIPQSVTVITQDEIQTRNMVTIDDVIRSTPGMTVSVANPNATTYSARGFPITAIQLDGVPTAIPAGVVAVAPDNLAIYDRVEILRGPAGLFNGFGGDGGVINLVRKRAPDSFQLSGILSGGTYANVRGQIDVGAPLNADGTVRFLAVGAEQYQHQMQDTTWQHDQQAYATIEADLAPGLTVRAGISYTDTNGRLMYEVPYVLSDSAFVHIPRSAYLGAPWNHYHNDRLGEFAELSRDFGGGWAAKLSYNHHALDTRWLNGIINLIDDPDKMTGEAYDYKDDMKENQHAVDFYLSGPFSLLGRMNRVTIGANYLNDHTNAINYIYNTDTGYDEWGDVSNVNIYDNSVFAPPSGFDGKLADMNNIRTQQVGLYGNVRLSITDRLTIVGGGRVTWWHSRKSVPDDPDHNYWGNSAANDRLGPKFSPVVGATYDIDRTFTAYASYTSIYVPQTGAYTFSGDLIHPIAGEQYEVGIKGEHLDGRLTTSIALFHTTETNNAVQDPQHNGYVLPSGRVRSQGVEVQAQGQITTGWTILAGYTYNDLKRDKDNSSNDFTVTETPAHLFKLSTDYVLPGALKRWTIGGSVNAQSKSYWMDCCGTTLHAPGHTIVGARIAYAFTPKISLTGSVTNIFDKYYLDSIGGAINTLGEPRKILFTLRAAY